MASVFEDCTLVSKHDYAKRLAQKKKWLQIKAWNYKRSLWKKPITLLVDWQATHFTVAASKWNQFILASLHQFSSNLWEIILKSSIFNEPFSIRSTFLNWEFFRLNLISNSRASHLFLLSKLCVSCRWIGRKSLSFRFLIKFMIAFDKKKIVLLLTKSKY